VDWVLIAWFLKNTCITVLVEDPVCRLGDKWPQRANDNFLLKISYDTVKELDPLFVKLPEWLRFATCMHEYVFAPAYLLLALCIAFRLPRGARLIGMWLGPSLAYALLFYTALEFWGSLPTPDPVMWSIVNLDYLVVALLLPFLRWDHLQKNKQE